MKMPNKVLFINRPQKIGNISAEFEIRIDRYRLGVLLVSKEGIVWRGREGTTRFAWEQFADAVLMMGTDGDFGAATVERSEEDDE